MKELADLVEARRKAPGATHAVATVIRVDGSSYRRTGARMLVGEDGRLAGSVSGGCLEKSVVCEAQAAIADGLGRLLSYDTTDPHDTLLGSGLGCRGKLWISIEVLPAGEPWILADIVDQVRNSSVPTVVTTHARRIESHAKVDTTALGEFSHENALDHRQWGWMDMIEEVLRSRSNRSFGVAGVNQVLLEWVPPPLALVLCGTGPDVQPLVRLGRELGHDVIVADARGLSARAADFPGATRVVAVAPAQLPDVFRADGSTAAVLMNHHYETDRDTLAALAPLGLPYIGLLGPRQRTDRIIGDLSERGLHLAPSAMETLHSPAGLDIGAEGPCGIALAILAEIQSVLAHREGGKLRFRTAPIHGYPGEGLACTLRG